MGLGLPGRLFLDVISGTGGEVGITELSGFRGVFKDLLEPMEEMTEGMKKLW